MLPPGLLLLLTVQSTDTLRVRPVDRAPTMDGVATVEEYGRPALTIPTAQGGVQVWAVWRGDTAWIAARLQDSTYYWGDDFVVSIDPLGDRTPGPGHDDTQWYLRRMLDSSVVNQGRHGRWMPPNDDPDWRLGASRSTENWAVQGNSGPREWSVELRLPLTWLTDETGRRATIALRSYDDSPHAWYSWPAPRAGERPTRVEMDPGQWAEVEREMGDGRRETGNGRQ